MDDTVQLWENLWYDWKISPSLGKSKRYFCGSIRLITGTQIQGEKLSFDNFDTRRIRTDNGSGRVGFMSGSGEILW